MRLRELIEFDVAGLGELFLDDLVAQVDAFIADVHTGTSDQLLHLLLTLSAERTLQQIATISDTCHLSLYLLPLPCCPENSKFARSAQLTRSSVTTTVPVGDPNFDR